MIIEGKCILPSSELDEIFDGFHFTGPLRPAKKVEMIEYLISVYFFKSRLHSELCQILLIALTTLTPGFLSQSARPKVLIQLFH